MNQVIQFFFQFAKKNLKEKKEIGANFIFLDAQKQKVLKSEIYAGEQIQSLQKISHLKKCFVEKSRKKEKIHCREKTVLNALQLMKMMQ